MAPMDGRRFVLLDLATDISENTRNQLQGWLAQNHPDNTTITLLRKPIPLATKFDDCLVSESYIDLLFRAKTNLDKLNVHDFTLLTSRPAKKFWEMACVHLFACVHNWTVVGVDVENQRVDLEVPDVEQVLLNVKNYLMSVGNPEDVCVLRVNTIPSDMFNAGFHTRLGGASQMETMASMNMIYTVKKVDPLVVIQENHRRLAQAAGFSADSLYITRAQHDKVTWVVGKGPRPAKHDGIVTNIPGVTIAAAGADCCVILLADVKTGACGAVHAGWAGTVKAAVQETLQTMCREFGTRPKDVRAAIGPTVEASCFSILLEQVKVLADLDPSLLTPHDTLEDRTRPDLVQANVKMLVKAGVPAGHIDTQWALCTQCNKDLFFSYERDGFPFGNQVGFISCKAAVEGVLSSGK